MLRRLVIFTLPLALSLAALPAADATRADDVVPGRIEPAKGIGALRLGMSEQAARRVMRRLGGSRRFLHLRRGTATEYLELNYPREFTAYSVGYLGRQGQRRVAYIAAHYAGNRTEEGIRVSTARSTLQRTYRGLLCRKTRRPNIDWGYRLECRLGATRARHTVFILDTLDPLNDWAPSRQRVTKIVIREPGTFRGWVG